MTPPTAAPLLFVRCDAGADDGLGHLSRCLAVADSARADGFDVRFLLRAPVDLSQRVLQAGYGVVAMAERAGDDATAVRREIEADTAERPVGCLLDSKYIEAPYVRDLRAVRGLDCVAAFDDEEFRNLPVDILINNNLFANATCYPAIPGREMLLGPSYNTVRPEYFALAKNHVRRGVLITMGGEDPANHSAQLLKILATELAGWPVEVVIGPAHPDPEAVHAAIRAYVPQAYATEAPPSLVAPMSRCSVALSAGGTTCYELLAAEVATVAVAVEPHQRKLIQALRQEGALADLEGDVLDPDVCRTLVRNLLQDPTTSANLVSNGRRLLAGPGAAKISTALLDRLR